MRCFCLSNTWSVNMAANKCTTCFYAAMDKDLEAPCMTCTGYSNWVTRDLYKPSHVSDTLQEAIDKWFEEEDKASEDFWVSYKGATYDPVDKPKHYMLFEDEGIEVRDVIRKLVEKVDEARMPYSPLFTADYVQMMQYLMRFMDKNGIEDLKKASWYLDKLIDAYESDV
jgi:hypothetical protein